MRYVILVPLLAVAACSKAPREPTADDMTVRDVSEVATEASSPSSVRAPGIDVTAAPGVAFNYRYAFRLPNGNIAGVQEAHAQACEKLGIDRCRITGMRYTVAQENDVTAMLAFKLDPTLARGFGKDGIAAIERAQGSLVDAAISGIDTAPVLGAAQRRGDDLRARLAALVVRRRAASDEERASIDAEITSLRAQLEREIAVRDDTRASLATTPMTFEYNSGAALSTSTIGRSWSLAVDGFVTALGWVIVIVGVLLPWLLVGGLMALGARRVASLLRRRTANAPMAEA